VIRHRGARRRSPRVEHLLRVPPTDDNP
jgi:hypothetical protein